MDLSRQLYTTMAVHGFSDGDLARIISEPARYLDGVLAALHTNEERQRNIKTIGHYLEGGHLQRIYRSYYSEHDRAHIGPYQAVDDLLLLTLNGLADEHLRHICKFCSSRRLIVDARLGFTSGSNELFESQAEQRAFELLVSAFHRRCQTANNERIKRINALIKEHGVATLIENVPEAELTCSIRNTLLRQGYTHLVQFTEVSDIDLLEIRGFGEKSLTALKYSLEKRGLQLAVAL